MLENQNLALSPDHSMETEEAPSHPSRKLPAAKISRVPPLLLLLICAAFAVLSLPPSPPPIELHPPDPFSFVAADNDAESIRTHLPSNDPDRRLQVREEQTTIPAFHLRTCQALIDGTIRSGKGILCCDRSHRRTDVCYMKGDVRTNSTSKTIVVYDSDETLPEEKIRPYTRKWETSIMSTIDELTLSPMPVSGDGGCDVRHNVTGVVMSTGGYTGNVYHEFNDGMIPLFLTAGRFGGEVVLVVVEYHQWWFDKYSAVVRRLTNYNVVDFRRDRRVHCFPEMIVGLRIHGELSIDPRINPTGKGINDFQAILNQAFGARPELPSKSPAIRLLPEPTTPLVNRRRHRTSRKPMIALFVRHGSRALVNLQKVVRHCNKLGFQVQLLDPKRHTPLADIYAVLHNADVMVAVHGAAVTHFLFMRPGTVLVQIVPLGLDWAADEYYGQPARRLGLDYMEYKVTAEESSLSREYKRSDPVIANPTAITQRGWQETKRIYLQHQNVTIDLRRFGGLLARARSRVLLRRTATDR